MERKHLIRGLLTVTLALSGCRPKPTATPSPTEVPTETSVPPITLENCNVKVTLDRDNIATLESLAASGQGGTEGLIYGPNQCTIHNNSANGWTIMGDGKTQGVGFYETSGGISQGQESRIRTYINPNKPNGAYSGKRDVVCYTHDDPSGQKCGEVSFEITLED